MPVEPTWQMWASLALIAAAVAIYATEWLSIELTSAGLLTSFLILFQLAPVPAPDGGNALDPAHLLAGFADPALVAVVALMVVAQGMIQTGALEAPLRRIAALRRHHPMLAVSAVLVLVALLSSVINNTPVVVIFIPMMTALAARAEHPPSSLMMPLSFAAILGGVTTLIGSSTNLLAAGAFRALGRPEIGFFDFTLPGSLLALVGMLYVVLAMPRLLPNRHSLAQERGAGDGKQYIAEILIKPDSPLVGKSIVAGIIPALPKMTVRLIVRGDEAFLPPIEDVELRAGDLVVVAATRGTLTEAIGTTPGLLPTDDTVGDGGQLLVEVVVAPASRMIGRNLKQIGFHYQTGCTVLGVQRRSRMIRAKMDEIRMEAGDVLLLVGSAANITALRSNRDVLLLEWSAHEIPALSYARRARVIFATVVAVAASGLLPIVTAALAGAAAMIAFGCLNVHQAARAVDRRVVLLVAAGLAMGISLEKTGGAVFLAQGLVGLLSDLGPLAVLSAFFLLVAVMTNVLSNNATALLFIPIGVGTALQLGVDPRIFAYAVIFGANCSFATPMGYQTNLLVMTPGHYRFGDFMRAGGPLVLLIWGTFTLFAACYYDL